MLKFMYFWIMILISMTFFFIGVYRNVISKIAYILWINDPNGDPKEHRDRVGIVFPSKRTIIDEVFLQKRIRERSTFLWIRHILIFLGFVLVFIFDQVSFFFDKLLKLDYFTMGAGRAPLKFGLELSGGVLLVGLTMAMIHRLLYRNEESLYVDIRLVSLLWAVVATGFLAEAFRFALEPYDQYKQYSFIAAPLAQLFTSPWWPWETLGLVMWIMHATLVGLLFACIPYSKFVHIFVSPVGRSITMGRDVAELKIQQICKGLL